MYSNHPETPLNHRFIGYGLELLQYNACIQPIIQNARHELVNADETTNDRTP